MSKKQILAITVFVVVLVGISLVYWIWKGSVNVPVAGISEKRNLKLSKVVKENAENGKITVYITGSVKKPGVYKVKKGTRLYQLLEYAGGSLPDADLVSLNLARALRDGEKIYIRSKKPKVREMGVLPISTHGSVLKSRINVNTASARELEELPGIGPKLAQRIIEYRNSHGGFKSVKELIKVKGIGKKKLSKILGMIVAE